MMFSKLSIFVVAILAAFATAASVPPTNANGGDSKTGGDPKTGGDSKTGGEIKANDSKETSATCPTGPVECCSYFYRCIPHFSNLCRFSKAWVTYT